jgi:hypothetical protein
LPPRRLDQRSSNASTEASFRTIRLRLTNIGRRRFRIGSVAAKFVARLRELISRRCRQLARFVHPETKLEKKGPLTPAVLQQMSAEQDELLRAHAGALEQAKVVPGRPE